MKTNYNNYIKNIKGYSLGNIENKKNYLYYKVDNKGFVIKKKNIFSKLFFPLKCEIIHFYDGEYKKEKKDFINIFAYFEIKEEIRKLGYEQIFMNV